MSINAAAIARSVLPSSACRESSANSPSGSVKGLPSLTCLVLSGSFPGVLRSFGVWGWGRFPSKFPIYLGRSEWVQGVGKKRGTFPTPLPVKPVLAGTSFTPAANKEAFVDEHFKHRVKVALDRRVARLQ
jgi:hypothetical protein